MNFSTTLKQRDDYFVLDAKAQVLFVVDEIKPVLVVQCHSTHVTEAERRLFQKVLMAFDLSRGRVLGGIT